MHAANFCWQNSHPILGYHSRVEEYAMSQQSKVTPPPYTPAPNGALGLTCPRRAADSCACGSACKDLGLYVHAAARNSKDKYFLKLRDVADSDYHGWPGNYPKDYWPHVVDPLLSPMLRDAILVTAQFLVGWMQFAKGLASFFYYDGNWTNRAGYLTNVSASADGSVWGVNAQQPATADNVYTWNGSGWQGVKGHLTWIAVGSKSEIWGVDSTLASNQNNIRRWNGTKWDTIPGYLTQIAAASDGTVWGVNAQQASNVNNIYRWTGSTWESVKGHLTSIAVGSKAQIWGANAKLPSETDNVFHFNSTPNWDGIKGYLTEIAVAPDGTIWGVNGQQFSDANNIYSWNQQTRKWMGVVGYLTQIAPTSASTFWGVNTEQLRYDIVQPNNIYQYKAPSA